MILTRPNHIKIYGHRGARGDLPENTLDSFEFLFENKITAYETDTLLTKDLVPAVNHDFRLNPALTKDSKGNWINPNDIETENGKDYFLKSNKKGLQNEQAFTKSKKVYYSIIEPSQAPSFTTLAEK